MMNRRRFYRQLALAAAATTTLGFRTTTTERAAARLRRPPLLRAGDTVGLIAPGSAVGDLALQRAVNNLESLDLRVKLGAFVAEERGYLAGTDEQRLADLYAMFADPGVQGIWCVRGGYGCTRLLPRIDFRLIRKNPKVLVGYSDITALHVAIQQETGLMTFHGPVGTSEFTDYTRDYLRRAIFAEAATRPLTIPLSPENMAKTEPGYRLEVIRPGMASGPLIGGNLSLLTAMVGTDYEPQVKGKILFIEEVGEKPYRIDRMLTQLRQALPLEKAAGIALGIFNDCQPDEDDQSLTLMETLKDRLGDLNIPVVYGLSFGHIANMCTLPVGAPARLDAQRGLLTLTGG